MGFLRQAQLIEVSIFTLLMLKSVMKKTILYGITASLMLLEVACSQSENSLGEYNSSTMKINLDGKNSSLIADQYSVDSVCHLSLPEGMKIHEITKFLVKNGRTYVMDSHLDRTIFVFDYNGFFLFKAGERGRAKNEYMDGPADFFVDDDDNIHVFDGNAKRVIVFGKEGKVMKTIDVRNYFPQSFGLLNNKKYAFDFNLDKLDGNTVLAVCNEKNEIDKKLLFRSENYYLFPSEQTFFVNGDRMAHIPFMSDSVLVFNKDVLEKVIKFDFGGRLLIKEKPKLATDKQSEPQDISDYNGVRYLSNYQESDDLILLEYVYQHYSNYWLYDKQNKKVIVKDYRLLDGLNPFYMYYIKDRQIVAIVGEEDVEIDKSDPDFDEKDFQKNYDISSTPIKEMFDGKTKLPAVVYISVK